jgi:hypothetical protein
VVGRIQAADEMFEFGSVFELNVDKARRLISSGDVACDDLTLDVVDAARRFLGLPADMSGVARGHPLGYRVAAGILGQMSARTYVDVDRLPMMPETELLGPGLMVTWNLAQASLTAARARSGQTDGAPDRSFDLLCDGNHRLARAFLAGSSQPWRCQRVARWDDIEKFLSCLGKPVVPPPGAAQRKDLPATQRRR